MRNGQFVGGRMDAVRARGQRREGVATPSPRSSFQPSIRGMAARSVQYVTCLAMSALIVCTEAAAQTTLPPALRTIVYQNAPFLIHEVKHSDAVPRQKDHILPTD